MQCAFNDLKALILQDNGSTYYVHWFAHLTHLLSKKLQTNDLYILEATFMVKGTMVALKSLRDTSFHKSLHKSLHEVFCFCQNT